VIRERLPGHEGERMVLVGRARGGSNSERMDDERVRAVVSEHYLLAWRLVRRLGVAPRDAEDAVQQVFIVISRRLGDIEHGSERAFVVSTAVRVASDARRAARRRPLELLADADDVEDASTAPDELAEQRRARRLLDALLEEMSEDVRSVFVLFEIEELSLTEISSVLGIPRGTVASRLARARAWFSEELERRKSAPPRKGEGP